jgi:anti-sigma factor RsiW
VSAHVRDRLSLYLDGEMAAGARSEVESHLRGCAACARHLEELAAVDAAARDLPVPAPPGYFESLPARVRARLPPARRKAPPVWVWAAAAGIAVAALVPVVVERTRAPLPEPALIREQAPPAIVITPPATVTAPPERVTLAAKDLGSIKLKAAPAPATPAVPAPAPFEPRAAENAAAAPPASAQVQKHVGPWAQAPAGAPAPDSARSETAPMEEGRAPKQVQGQADAEAKAEREQDRRPGLTDAVATFARAPSEETRYRALLARRTATAAEDRQLHDEWRALAASSPTGAHADEARVRALDALLAAYRREGEARDRERLREEAGLYLQRGDAAQPDRVRAILEAAGLPPSLQ